jgi:hypothetical protein
MRYKHIERHQVAFWFRSFSVRRRINDPLSIAVGILRERVRVRLLARNYNSWWLSRRYRIGRYRRLVS